MPVVFHLIGVGVMPGMYEDERSKLADIFFSRSSKACSIDAKGRLVPVTVYEKVIHAEDRAAATARLAIDKAMKV